MEKSTKKTLEGLHDLNRLSKDDMNKLLGGNEKDEKKKKGKLWNLFAPSPCRADLPQ